MDAEWALEVMEKAPYIQFSRIYDVVELLPRYASNHKGPNFNTTLPKMQRLSRSGFLTAFHRTNKTKDRT